MTKHQGMHPYSLILTILHSVRPKLDGVLAVLSAIGSKIQKADNESAFAKTKILYVFVNNIWVSDMCKVNHFRF